MFQKDKNNEKGAQNDPFFRFIKFVYWKDEIEEKESGNDPYFNKN